MAEVVADKLIENGPFVPAKIKEDHGGKLYLFNTSTRVVDFF